MNKYYIDGVNVSPARAYLRFCDAHTYTQLDRDEVRGLWNSLQTSEEMRDMHLPDGLEIVQS